MREFWPRVRLQVGKNDGNLVGRLKIKKVTNFICFANFPGKQQHVNVTNGSWSTVFVGNWFFRKTWRFLSPLLWCEDTFFPQTLFTDCINLSTPLNTYASQQSKEPWFLNVKCWKKFHACPSIKNQPSDILAYPITVRRFFTKQRSNAACDISLARK